MANLSRQKTKAPLCNASNDTFSFFSTARNFTVLILLSLLFCRSALAQVPTITSFNPTQASAGSTININGTNFTGTTSVTIGGTATPFTLVSATKITVVLGYGSSGSIVVTNGSGSASLAGFYYLALNRIITDFGGFWSSTLIAPNAIKPDSSHNLLAFRYNNIIYSTGANDAKLASNGISYTASSFRALPVANISGNNPGGSVYLALAKKVDGSANVANPSTVSNLTLSGALTDGIRGLDLGTGFTNLPSTANLTFNVFSIDTAKIADAEPDIILTQIAQPVSGNDIFSLVDASGTLIGNTVTQDMTLLNPFGNYDLDLFNLTPNAPFNIATAYSAAATNTNREIRLVALKLSDFGINSLNASQIKMLKIAPSTNSDYAFIAYNTSAINMPPNISQNTSLSNTTICSGGTAAMEVIATAAAGGNLSYSWERSANGGSTWATLTNGGGISGATTKRLVVIAPTNTHQYRVTVTESSTGLSSTSAVFTITVSAPTAPTAVTIAGGSTVCRYTAVQLTSSVSGGSNLYYQWQSSPSSTGTYTDISGANLSSYLPQVAATGILYYKLVASSGSGCSGSVTSASQVVTVTGVATASGTAICNTGSATLSATVTSGTIDWYAVDTGGTSLYTGSNYSTPSISATTTYYVAASGCASAIRQAVTATVNPVGKWIGGASGDWNTAANWCGGVPVSSTNVNIPSGAAVSIQSANAVANNIAINNGASLTMTGAYNLNITAGGNFVNNGTYTATGSTGTIAFLGGGTITGTTTFNNIDAYGILNFGIASTVSGTFTLQTGGSVTGNSPLYTCPSSILLYKPGSIFVRGLEWSNSSSGAGCPANVYLQNNTTVNFPGAGTGYVCNDVQIDAGSSLRQDYSGGSAALRIGRNITISGILSLGGGVGGDIYVGGNWVRNTGGIFNANDRVVTFDGPSNFSGNGTSISSITAPASAAKDNEGGFGGEKFAQLWMNKTNATDSVVLLSNITLTRELGLTKGTFSLRNSDVTMVSNSSRTADIAPVSNTLNVTVRYGGTGRFVIQRFIQNPTNTRSWRLLSAPLQSATSPTINEAWQEGAANPDRNNPNANSGAYNPWPGYGTHITGPNGAYSSTNGFDQGTNSASVLFANSGVSAWTSPASTLTTKITDQQGWMLFVRGDRGFTIGSQYVPSQNTTLETRGKVNIGNVSVAVTAAKQIIANPYASAISLLNADIAGTAGKNSTYYMWDPKMFTSYTQPGKWVTFTGVGTSFVQTTSESPYTTDGNIESGQAFAIDVVSPGNIVFHESDKKPLTSSLVGISNATSSRPAGNNFAMLRSDIYVNNGSDYKVTDGVLNIFGNDYNNAIDNEDAKKMVTFNTKESLSILRSDSVKIAIEKRAAIQQTDTIFFSMNKFNELPYQFRFEANNFGQYTEAYLEDALTGSHTQISTNGITSIDFNITSDPLSKAANRFRVVFNNGFVVLPVTFTTVKAEKQNKNIAVQWKVENELNIHRYIIERSTDGKNFEKVNSTNAANKSAYAWLDVNAGTGNNYYRIKAQSDNEKFIYSNVVKATTSGQEKSVNIAPNLITDGIIKIIFNNVIAGNYRIVLYDNAGKKIISKELICGNGNSVQQIMVSKTFGKGLYYAQITGTGYNNKIKVVMQ